MSGVFLLMAVFGQGDWIDDPSREPITDWNGKVGERVRFLADFSADGIEDMALSDVVSSFGNAGGSFDLFLANGQGQYRKHGYFFAHPSAIALEQTESIVRIWTYHRDSASEGGIGYREVSKTGLSDWDQISIFPGDGGTDMGRAIYAAVFGNSSVSIRVESSVTVGDRVLWRSRNDAWALRRLLLSLAHAPIIR